MIGQVWKMFQNMMEWNSTSTLETEKINFGEILWWSYYRYAVKRVLAVSSASRMILVCSFSDTEHFLILGRMPFVWDHSLGYVYHTFFSSELCLYGQEQRKITSFSFYVLSEKESYILDSVVCSWSCKGQHYKNALNMILITDRLKIILLSLLLLVLVFF